MSDLAPTSPRGRPRRIDDDQILRAALTAFAAHGFEGMSLRALHIDLGLAHGAINQRFGSKLQLFHAAIDHGFATFFAEIAAERARFPATTDPLDELREQIRAFLRAAARRPELGRLMNLEGLHHSEHLGHIVRTVTGQAIEPLAQAVQQLADAGRIHHVSARALFFLIAHGAEAPYTLTALSDAFDPIDGELDPMEHADAMTGLIMRGLRR